MRTFTDTDKALALAVPSDDSGRCCPGVGKVKLGTGKGREGEATRLSWRGSRGDER